MEGDFLALLKGGETAFGCMAFCFYNQVPINSRHYTKNKHNRATSCMRAKTQPQ